MSLESSRWFSFARFDRREVDAWHELLLQLGVRLPPDLAEVSATRGLFVLPTVSTQSGAELSGSLSFDSVDSVFANARRSATQVKIGTLDEVREFVGEGDDELFVDGTGKIGRNGRWTNTLAEQLDHTESMLRDVEDESLEAEPASDPERSSSEPDLEADVARKRARKLAWWSYDWRRVFRGHADPLVAREILEEVGNAHSATRGGGAVGVDDLVHRLPESSRRAWVVEELHAAGPPTAELAVSLDELSEALDGRPLPREKLERLVPQAWTDRSPRVDAQAQWARALLFALGKPVAEHLLHAVRLVVGGPIESLARWERALALARRAAVI